MSKRGYRIHVERCGDCPFAYTTAEDHPTMWCEHPASGSHVVGSGWLDTETCPTVTDDGSMPDWCPLRGAVTMIAGPKTEEQKESP